MGVSVAGGPALIRHGDGSFALIGISTFAEGFGERFGDLGGGIVLEPHWNWIFDASAITIIPEPALVPAALGVVAFPSSVRIRMQRRRLS